MYFWVLRVDFVECHWPSRFNDLSEVMRNGKKSCYIYIHKMKKINIIII